MSARPIEARIDRLLPDPVPSRAEGGQQKQKAECLEFGFWSLGPVAQCTRRL